jgi:hypothetical protein
VFVPKDFNSDALFIIDDFTGPGVFVPKDFNSDALFTVTLYRSREEKERKS